ncbi:MAG: beta-lactamase family protein, partial [Spirochaetales bacterium]|nr:beta-lactamase family protein [Spirochaetales bacterium]
MKKYVLPKNLLWLIQIFFLSICAVFVYSACTFFPDYLGLRPATIPIGDYSYTIEYAERAIRRGMSKHDIPAVAVALIDDQSVLFEQAYGFADVESARPATIDTVFNAGSITKVFTGIEVMRMAEEGLIDLDSPISAYVPGFSIRAGSYGSEPITIRSILNHRSGLPRNGSLLTWFWDASPDVLAAQLASVADLYQAFPVGYRYKYSNIGYDVLGRLIEVVRGYVPPDGTVTGAFPYYMKETLLEPLGMASSSFGSRALLYGDLSSTSLSTGYFEQDGSNVAYNQFDLINLASGNLNTTLRDLERFTHMILAGGIAGDVRIIGEDTLDAMFQVQSSEPSDPQTNGLTWFTDTIQLGEKAVFHSGTNQGRISIIAMLPEKKLGVILLANSDSFEEINNQLAFAILSLL